MFSIRSTPYESPSGLDSQEASASEKRDAAVAQAQLAEDNDHDVAMVDSTMRDSTCMCVMYVKAERSRTVM